VGLLDHPNERSSHARATPRGGGLAIVIGTACGLALSGEPMTGEAAALLGGAGAMALLGLADDRWGLSVGIRLAVEAAAALVIAAMTGGFARLPLPAPLDLPLGPLAIPLAAVWVVAVLNIFNFLDGIDGLAGGQAVVTGLGVAATAWDPAAAAIGGAAAGGAAGFLVFNWTPARIFMGDVGSLALGYTFASLPLLAATESRPAAVFWMVMSLWLFLADATRTLVARAARGERFYLPHREHLYQRLVQAGHGHAAVSLALLAGSLVLTAAAVALWPRLDGRAGWMVFGVAVALFLAEAAAASRAPRRPAAADAR
jgi:UDP-N-acetylmuramyl pentapeptide phosphotransferase/UDP-N-acetylglucosamine-1-phosphate transferase